MNTIQTLYKCFSCCHITLFLKCVHTAHQNNFYHKNMYLLKFYRYIIFFLIKNCNCSIFWLLYMIICSEMIWHIYYSKSEVEEMKKAMEEELRKNQEEIENMKKTWQERLSEQETANKVQIFPISHVLLYFPFPIYFS